MSVAGLLRRSPLFADLREEELSALANCLGRRVFARDAILFHQGSPAQSLYLIESGAVRIFADGEMGQEITLDIHGPDECFGETALLDGNVHLTSAMALEKTVTYALRLLGALAGIVAWGINVQIFRSSRSTAVKFILTAVVSLLAVVVYIALAALFTGAVSRL